MTRSAPLSHRRGRLGERAACRHLKRSGLKFLVANYACPHGEIDLVFRDKDCLVFVEVKTRSPNQWTRPAAAVNRDKQRRIIRTSRHYRRRLRQPDVKYRYDVVEVIVVEESVVEVRHLRDAFRE